MLSENIKKTSQIAELFLQKILNNKKKQKGALVVCLSGDLGAGKTAFTQAAAKYLGIKDKIASPTFVIMKKYPVPEQPARQLAGGARYGAGPIKNLKPKFLFHFDAYRLKNEEELLKLGWEEIIKSEEHLVFIEWPENVKKAIPANARFVFISHGKNDLHRNLKLKPQ